MKDEATQMDEFKAWCKSHKNEAIQCQLLHRELPMSETQIVDLVQDVYNCEFVVSATAGKEQVTVVLPQFGVVIGANIPALKRQNDATIGDYVQRCYKRISNALDQAAAELVNDGIRIERSKTEADNLGKK